MDASTASLSSVKVNVAALATDDPDGLDVEAQVKGAAHGMTVVFKVGDHRRDRTRDLSGSESLLSSGGFCSFKDINLRLLPSTSRTSSLQSAAFEAEAAKV